MTADLALGACGRAWVPMRRSWRLNSNHYGALEGDPRYAALPPEVLPRGESLHDVTERLLPSWHDAIVPDLHRHGCVLVASHGDTLRALVKHLEGVGGDASAGLDVPNAVPACYQLASGHATRLT